MSATKQRAYVIPLPIARQRSSNALTVPVRDGTATLRPLTPGEVGPLEAVFAGLSTSSREARYLVPVQALTRSMRDLLTAVDGHDHLAWLASVDGRPAGIARVVATAPGTGEIAFEVVDEHHGRGLGSVLVDAVTTAASASGIRRLQATVLPSNRRSLHLLGRLGVRLRPQDGLLEGEGPMSLVEPPRVDRAAVVRLACAARAVAAGPAPGGPDKDWACVPAAAH